jgi:cell division protein FtsB
MAPRRPTAPQVGAARVTSRPALQPRGATGRAAPAGRSGRVDRPPATGRASSRPLPAPGTPSGGVGAGNGRAHGPLIRPVTMLSAVFIALVLLLAPYIRPWVTQRSEIAEANEQMRQLQQEVEDLSVERRRWDDPAYVRAQARRRLHFVMPGETGYVLLDDASPAAVSQSPRSAAALAAASQGDKGGSTEPWYGRLWASVRVAGGPTTEQAWPSRTPGTGS